MSQALAAYVVAAPASGQERILMFKNTRRGGCSVQCAHEQMTRDGWELDDQA